MMGVRQPNFYRERPLACLYLTGVALGLIWCFAPSAQSQMWQNEDDESVALAAAQPTLATVAPTTELLLQCTREPQLLTALQLMTTPSSSASQQWILKHRVKVLFRAMETLDKGLKDYDALSWLSPAGQQVIFINQAHRQAPPEALAAILSHEAMHHDAANSIQEEITAWTIEARAWQELRSAKANIATLPNFKGPLVERLETLRVVYAQQGLPQLVRKNTGYSGLPEHSPGF